MSMIGLDILHGFSKFIGDYWVGETSTAGTTTTMVMILWSISMYVLFRTKTSTRLDV